MNVVIIGAQWGDEGKGKIVDFLASDAQIVVRFFRRGECGPHHCAGGREVRVAPCPLRHSLSRQDSHPRLGHVIDPEALFRELEDLEKKGIDWKGRVLIPTGRTLCCRDIGTWTGKLKGTVQSPSGRPAGESASPTPQGEQGWRPSGRHRRRRAACEFHG